MPTNEPKTEQSAQPVDAKQPLRKILLADSSTTIRLIVREILLLDGHDVYEAADGHEAVSAAANEKFDLIMMDISTPLMDGRRAYQAIRSGNGPNVVSPIVVFTANLMPDEVAVLLADGVDGTLSKPISVKALRQIVLELGGGRPTKAAVTKVSRKPVSILDLSRAGETRDLLGEPRFTQLLEKFVAEMDALTGWLSQIPKPPRAEIKAQCHKFASNAGTFGANDLRLAMIAAERAAGGAEDQDLGQVCSSVVALWADTREAFDALDWQ